jgi:hypothetical protein
VVEGGARGDAMVFASGRVSWLNGSLNVGQDILRLDEAGCGQEDEAHVSGGQSGV